MMLNRAMKCKAGTVQIRREFADMLLSHFNEQIRECQKFVGATSRHLPSV